MLFANNYSRPIRLPDFHCLSWEGRQDYLFLQGLKMINANSITPEMKGGAPQSLGSNLIFLVSQPRSGSTLLQRVLGSHSDVFTLAEPWVMLHPIYALRQQGIQTEYNARYAREGLEDFMTALPGGRKDYIAGIRAMASTWYDAILQDKPASRFLDKTPRYYNIIPELKEVFPESKVVILLRNPLSVLSSVIKTWVGKNWAQLQLLREDALRAPAMIVQAMQQLGDRAIIFRYEPFVQNPEVELSKLCARIGIPFEPDMLEYGLKPKPAGRMGDSVGVHQHSRPVNTSLDKWKETFKYPTYRLLAEIVLTLTGK